MAMVTAGATADSACEKELKSVVGAVPPVTTAEMANSAWVKMRIKPEYVEDRAS